MHRLIIMPTSRFYNYWEICIGLNNIYAALLYPYCLAFGFPGSLNESMFI